MKQRTEEQLVNFVKIINKILHKGKVILLSETA